MDISIILAAGEGTRMKSQIPKILHKVCGKPLLEYVVNASEGAGINKNIVIVGHGKEEVRKYFQDRNVIFKEQPIGKDIPYGTGFAVMQGKEYIEDEGIVVVLCGDTPLITEDTLKELLAFHKKGGFDGTVLTALLDDPEGYGRIERDEVGNISRIVEQKDANEEEQNIKEINSGIYCFDGSLLKYALGKLNNDNAQGEFYITDVVGILRSEGYKIGAYIVEDNLEIHGVNSRIQLAISEKIMRNMINKTHMENGVTLIDPDNTYIEDGVSIGRDTIIYPGVSIQGSTKIGRDCIIRSNSRIVDSEIQDQVEVDSSLIESSFVGSRVTIGPYAHLRPKSRIGEAVHIGNFVEVKNSRIGENSKAGHLAYIGDAVVGRDVNIGCGVIFANYNGRDKQVTTVGDNAFIGSNSNLVAPITIEDRAYIAAGSTITQDVEAGSLSIARAQQVNKRGWVDKKDLEGK